MKVLNRPNAASPIARWEWGALAALMLAALVPRLFALGRLPAVFFHDECDNLVNVYQILNGNGPGVFGLDWKPQPALSIYLLSVFMRADMSVFALRLPAALFSVAALLPVYLLARRAVGAVAALLTTWLLATDVWYLHFSRSGWDNVYTCLFITGAALCVDDALRHGRLRSFIGAGVWSALGLYGYAAGRAILPATLIVMLSTMLRPHLPRRRLAVGALLTATVALTLFAPQVPAIVSGWDHLQERPNYVYILKDQSDRSIPEKVAIVAGNFGWKAAQLFASELQVPPIHEQPDRYLRMEYGAFVRPTAVILLVGLLLSLSRVATLAVTWQWWVFLLVSFGMTEALTFGSLNGARGIIFVPILYLFVGLALDSVWRAAPHSYRPVAALLVAGSLAVSGWSLAQYFEWVQSPRFLTAIEPAIPVEEFPAWQSYVLDWTARSNRFFTVDMWKEHKRGLLPKAANDQLDIDRCGARNAVAARRDLRFAQYVPPDRPSSTATPPAEPSRPAGRACRRPR